MTGSELNNGDQPRSEKSATSSGTSSERRPTSSNPQKARLESVAQLVDRSELGADGGQFSAAPFDVRHLHSMGAIPDPGERDRHGRSI